MLKEISCKCCEKKFMPASKQDAYCYNCKAYGYKARVNQNWAERKPRKKQKFNTFNG